MRGGGIVAAIAAVVIEVAGAVAVVVVAVVVYLRAVPTVAQHLGGEVLLRAPALVQPCAGACGSSEGGR
jgi:hypothetical protein